jgi:hypothetical protein
MDYRQPATNVIRRAGLPINIRFNDDHTGAALTGGCNPDWTPLPRTPASSIEMKIKISG